LQAIILAGGLGSRLRPITDYVPKSLIPINNIPLIEWQIKQLKKFKVNSFIICTGYKADQIENYLEQKENFDSKIQYSIEESPLGTGGAIKKAVKMIKEKSFLVVNGDIITNIDVRKLYPHQNSIALVELRTKFGTVDLDDYKITKFKEKKPIQNVWMNAGIYHLNKKIVLDLPTKGAIEETTFRRFADKGTLVGVKFKNAFWHSIDSHKDLDECSKALKGKKP
jgi:NDP-sugar pyrophosphorylase family protein